MKKILILEDSDFIKEGQRMSVTDIKHSSTFDEIRRSDIVIGVPDVGDIVYVLKNAGNGRVERKKSEMIDLLFGEDS